MLRTRRILILAQIPPPTHGQSVMVGFLVTALTKQFPGQVIHLNLKLSKDEQDVGTMRPGKLLRLAFYACRALLACTLGGARTIYYVPAPAKRGAILRDLLLLGILKPFTRNFILHWHSVGLGEYVAQHRGEWTADCIRRLLRCHGRSICLSREAARDVSIFKPQSVTIVPNGIPDPCPDFQRVYLARMERLRQRQAGFSGKLKEPVPVHLLYLGLCIRSKGIFKTLQTAISILETLNRHPANFFVTLTIAGPFRDDAEKIEFEAEWATAIGSLPPGVRTLFHLNMPGFAGPEMKQELLESADLFLFPTTYENEGLPLTILEALAWGLPVVSTRWRAIPEIFPENYPFLSDPYKPAEFADLAQAALTYEGFDGLRNRFEERFSLSMHLSGMTSAIFAPFLDKTVA